MTDRIGDFIQTYSGINFYPLDPKPSEINIADIAQSLSLKTRFNGHCIAFYSVAEHSVRCADWLLNKYSDHNLSLWGLLHDAAEGYTADIPRPLKPFIKGFKDIENNILKSVAERFSLTFPMPKEIKEVDDILLATESRDLMGHSAFEKWGKFVATPLPETIVPVDWEDAKTEFLDMFKMLTA